MLFKADLYLIAGSNAKKVPSNTIGRYLNYIVHLANAKVLKKEQMTKNNQRP